MPKFAANLTMLFTEQPFMQRFALAHQAGFKAVEFLFPYAYSAEGIAHQLEHYQLELALFNLPPGDWENGERGIAALPEREEEFKHSVTTALHYATALNCTKLHAMAGIVDPRFTREQHIETLINNLRYAADQCAKHDITLLIEPLNHRDIPNYLIAHQREAAQLIQRIDRPNVKLQFDAYHAQIMDGDLTQLITDLAPVIGHVQIASVPERHEPSEGELNYAHIFATLDAAHYHGWIGCEYHPKQTTQDGLGWLAPYQSLSL